MIAGGRVVDPAAGVDAVVDLGVRGGRVEAVEPGGSLTKARRYLEVEGLVVMPGIIDLHVHLAEPFGKPHGIAMVARAGVTACLELAGHGPSLARAVRESGCGINVGYVAPLIPGRNLTGPDPDEDELAGVLDVALAEGALGLKLLGGHYPLTPEAIRRAVELATDRGCYLAIHCGSTENGSDVAGLEEAVEIAGDAPVQIAHVNSYCRGQLLGDPVEEARRAIRALEGRRLVSESYLSRWNGTSGRCEDGVPVSRVTRTCLRMGGYPETEEGLERAVEAGYALVNVEYLGGTELVGGAAGLEILRRAGGEPIVSFPANPPEVTALLATAKHEGRFVVTALATDGGSIPRNTTVEQGLALVRYGMLSLAEFVEKAAAAPAAMLGLRDRGSLRPGSAADVTVLDVARGEVAYTLVGGDVVFARGALTGRGGRLLTTDVGVAFATSQGIGGEAVRRAA